MTDVLENPIALIGVLAIALLVVLLPRRITLGIGNFHAELRPNGGHSMKDRADRTDRNLYVIAEHLGIAGKLEPPPEKDRRHSERRSNEGQTHD